VLVGLAVGLGTAEVDGDEVADGVGLLVFLAGP
jgi:hypothetical protein